MSGEIDPRKTLAYTNRKVIKTSGVIPDPYSQKIQKREIENLKWSQRELHNAPKRIALGCLLTATGCVLVGGGCLFLYNNPQIADQLLKIFNP